MKKIFILLLILALIIFLTSSQQDHITRGAFREIF